LDVTEDLDDGPQGSEQPVPAGQPTGPARAGRGRRSTALLIVLALVGGVAFATMVAFVATRLHSQNRQISFRPAGIPANVSTSMADQMQLSPVPTAAAPGFTLTDQNGRPVSLASFRGKTVVLTFMDPHCTDICPIVSREFIDAHRYLGAAAAKVVFVAVNVNQFHNQVSDVAGYSRAHQLDSIGPWYFLTGSLASLRAVWDAYQIQVEAPSPNADIRHTSLIYFIDSHGRERYVAAPMVDHTKQGIAYLPPGQLTSWARGIALVTRDVTP
jgi:cytochrome oxidase Cu insertion factor (SCO1/SenC/PrrC family)